MSQLFYFFFFPFNGRAFSIAVSLSMRKEGILFLPQTIDNIFFCPLNYSLSMFLEHSVFIQSANLTRIILLSNINSQHFILHIDP